MPENLLRIASALLAAVFAWAAVAKLSRLRAWTSALQGYGLPEGLASVARWAVPAAELAVVGAILVGQTLIGSALVLVLLVTFSLAIVRAHSLRGGRLPCGCFGRTKARDYRWMLVRNAVLSFIAAAILLEGRDLSLTKGFSMPSGAAILPAVLVIVGCGLATWMVVVSLPTLRRQRGHR